MQTDDDLLSAKDLFGEDEDESSFERRPFANDQLFRQIRLKLIMNVHKVSEDVAVMMMKANDMPKRREK